MLYGILRELARIALHWYYSDIFVQGRERIPSRGPVLIVANHPNALVDALLVGTAIPRRVLLTATATLFDHPLLAPLLLTVGVVPLHRAKDAKSTDAASTSARNAEAFLRVTNTLRDNQVVLIFPEGISHDEPMLAPLRTGAARIAMAAKAADVRGLCILPMGLIFEAKERPRSRVLVRIGEPLNVDAWSIPNASDVAALTREINMRLRLITLNFVSSARAERSVRLAGALAALSSEPLSLGEPLSFSSEATIAQRVETATEALEHASPALGSAVDSFLGRLEELESRLTVQGASLADAKVSPHIRHGAWFVLREVLILLLAFPAALFGRLTHWLPIFLARTLARRSLGGDPSRDQPAMRTILIGALAVVMWYALQALLLTRWFGWRFAVLWVVATFIAARIELRFDDRLARASRRARTYLALRRNVELRASISGEMDALLREAFELECALQVSARDGEQFT